MGVRLDLHSKYQGCVSTYGVGLKSNLGHYCHTKHFLCFKVMILLSKLRVFSDVDKTL